MSNGCWQLREKKARRLNKTVSKSPRTIGVTDKRRKANPNINMMNQEGQNSAEMDMLKRQVQQLSLQIQQITQSWLW